MKTRVIHAIIELSEARGILYDEDALYLSSIRELNALLAELLTSG